MSATDLGGADTALPSDSAGVSNTGAQSGAPLLPGTQVGRYEIVELVGAGGMGMVYRARDRSLGRAAAIKLQRATEAGALACGLMCRLLLKEARAMAQLSHPNLVAVYDVGEHDGCVYVAMEYVEGTSLRSWIGNARPDFRTRTEALLAAGRGLVAAHEARVLHRDFKPDNVLVATDGRVKVVDFGLARRMGDLTEEEDGEVTCRRCAPEDVPDLSASDIVGTPGYVAPECFRGVPYDSRSDQFAFAVTAWEILSGTHPFPDALGELVSTEALSVEEPDASLVPPKMTDLLRRALRPQPSTRYPSLGVLLQQVEAALGDG